MTFSYLSDVYIDKQHRRRGLSKWVLEKILTTHFVTDVRSVFLMTRCRIGDRRDGSSDGAHTSPWVVCRSAQKLYAKFGFEVVENRCMVYRPGVAQDVGRYDWRLVEYPSYDQAMHLLSLPSF